MINDEEQVRHLIAEMYATISGPAGPRDWARDRAVFHPQARLMRVAADGQVRFMTLDEFIETVTPFLASNDLYEVETEIDIRLFGDIGHVWSAYDMTPEGHGVNTFQVYRDVDGRWWIVSMLWANEGTGRQPSAFGDQSGRRSSRGS